MPSLYLQPADYVGYGLPNTTTSIQVQQASALIDAYLQRPEGLVYKTDLVGQPCYMASLNPTQSWQSQGTISPGNAVSVPLTVQVQPWPDIIGDVVILDRGNPSSTEACIVQSMTAGNLVLASVRASHSANCTIDFGLTIFEERALPAKRSIMRVMRPPLWLLSGLGRYGYGRRTDQQAGMFNEVNLLAAIEAFGGPPMWEAFDVSQASSSMVTREVWIPAGILLAYFSEVRLRYISGFAATAIPPVVKQATSNLVATAAANPALPNQIKMMKAGQNQLQRFTASLIDNDTRAMLDTMRAIPTA